MLNDRGFNLYLLVLEDTSLQEQLCLDLSLANNATPAAFMEEMPLEVLGY